MFGTRLRGLLLIAALGISMLCVAEAATPGALNLHREAVDEQAYPWSAIGKLFTEGGSECSGVLISRDKILTAAHCLFNYRTGRYTPAGSLHFLVGYHTGRYSAHARIASYEVGAGFDPLRYGQTNEADWAILTVTKTLPASVEPLRLRRELAPSGTKAVLVGYPQDRALAMTADRNCELREKFGARGLLQHTCRGIKGYSGAPLLVSAEGGEMQIAGIQIAVFQGDGTETMIAVPAESIWRQDRDEIRNIPPVVVASVSEPAIYCGGPDDSVGEGGPSLHAIWARLEFDGLDIVSSIPEPANATFSNKTTLSSAMAWLEYEPSAVAIP